MGGITAKFLSEEITWVNLTSNMLDIDGLGCLTFSCSIFSNGDMTQTFGGGRFGPKYTCHVVVVEINGAGEVCEIMVVKKIHRYRICLQHSSVAYISASAVERAVIFCRFDDQEMGPPAKYTM